MKRTTVVLALLAAVVAVVGAVSWTLAVRAEPRAVLIHAGDVRTIDPAAPALSLTKTVGTNSAVCAGTSDIAVAPGTVVTYCYSVTNTGAITLTRHTLVDSELGVVLNDFPYLLAPQASAFLTETATIAETTTNTATWTAYNPGPVDVYEASDRARVTVPSPSITLAKTVGTDPARCATTKEIAVGPNTEVTYCYEVTNTGVITLSLHTLIDSELGVVLNDFPYALAPQASAFLTETATIAETTTNTATWTAFNPGPSHVATDTDSATVIVSFRVFLPIVRAR
ncbi:MAG: DUF7507 domain-containing protein [Anaerolineae bacterium]